MRGQLKVAVNTIDGGVLFFKPRLFGGTGVRDMATAIIGTYTPEGFVVASDGLETSTIDSSLSKTDVQKVFPIEYPNRILAYAVMGNPVVVEDVNRSAVIVDFPVQIREQARLLHKHPHPRLKAFSAKIFEPVTQILSAAKKSGRIGEYPKAASLPHEEGDTIVRVLFMGYFNGVASQTTVRLYTVAGKLRTPAIEERSPDEDFQYGSDAVARLVQSGDPRFAKYRAIPDLSRPLKSAADIAKGFIDAYGDTEAMNVDPANCRTIGGQTQVYTITRQRVSRVYPA